MGNTHPRAFWFDSEKTHSLFNPEPRTTDVLVRYPDGSCMFMPMERAARLYADEIGLKTIGREGFQLVVHRR